MSNLHSTYIIIWVFATYEVKYQDINSKCLILMCINKCMKNSGQRSMSNAGIELGQLVLWDEHIFIFIINIYNYLKTLLQVEHKYR